MKKAIFITFILFFTLAVKAQSPHFTTDIDTNRILIGEQIRLNISATIPANANFTWPVFPDSVEGLELVSAGKLDTIRENQNWNLHQDVIITSFDSGYFAIPPLELIYNQESYLSEAIAIEVRFPQFEEDADYYDIKKNLEVERNWLLIALVIAGVLLLISFIIFIVRYFKKENKRKFDIQQRRLSPAQFALKQLDELEKENLWQKDHLKEYYSRLIDILRVYLQRRFAISAMESTAEELIDQIEELNLAKDLFDEIREILLIGVMVKYAKDKPGPAENEKAIMVVRRFVEETRYDSQQKEEVDA